MAWLPQEQVASDTVMGRFYSGIGGQVDFIRGAARSPGGEAIIALRSTAKDGGISRIQTTLEPGAGIVTSRGDVHYVVTEYGIADLWGKSVRERAKALISIAHPDFRAEPLDAAKQHHFVFPDQVVPKAIYPWKEERIETLPSNGGQIMLRPVRITDERPLQEFFYALSNSSHRLALLAVEPLRAWQCQWEPAALAGDASALHFRSVASSWRSEGDKCGHAAGERKYGAVAGG